MCRTAFIIILAFLVSCSSSETTQSHTFLVYEENGVTVAETKGGPKYIQELFTYEYLFTLQEDEREQSILAMPHTPYMDEEGNIYLVDGRGSYIRIAVFDQTGVYQQDISRAGNGPGEYQSPVILSIDRDILTIWDRQLLRLSRYNLDGTFIDMKSIPRSQISGILSCQWFDENTILAICTSRFSPSDEYSYQQTQVIVISSDGDTLWTDETERIMGGKIIQEQMGNLMIYSPLTRPFNPRPVALYSPVHGVMLTTGKEPVLDFLGHDGALRFRIRIDLPLIPVTTDDKQHYESERRAIHLESGRLERAEIEKRLRLQEYPENKAYWQIVSVDEAGYIWIQIPEYYEGSGTVDDGLVYRVVSPEGEYLGITRYPPGPGIISHGHLLSIKTDPETDERKIFVYRINAAVEGLKYP